MHAGLHSAPLEALFADSIASGQRSLLYVRRSSLRTPPWPSMAFHRPSTDLPCPSMPFHALPCPSTQVRRSSLRTLGNALGPILSIFVFAQQDEWTLGQLRLVMLVGLVGR